MVLVLVLVVMVLVVLVFVFDIEAKLCALQSRPCFVIQSHTLNVGTHALFLHSAPQ
jgi:hypothetical protein